MSYRKMMIHNNVPNYLLSDCWGRFVTYEFPLHYFVLLYRKRPRERYIYLPL